jgi:peroxiredoxin Q/BCP
MYGKKYMGILRTTFVVDADGRIARVFPKVQPKKHDALVLNGLRAIPGRAST